MNITNESDISLSQALAALEDVQNQECLSPYTKASIRDHLLQAYNDGLPKINLKPQPEESPDVNLNDLGFYTSLDKQIGSFREFESKIVSRTRRTSIPRISTRKNKLVKTKVNVVREIYNRQGRNDFKLPHGLKLPRNKEKGHMLDSQHFK